MFNGILLEDLESICGRVREPLRSLSGRRILVSGAAGFLPGYLVNTLLHANDTYLSPPCQVICLDNLLTGSEHRLDAWKNRADVVVLNQSATQPVSLLGEIDYIVHAASIASPPVYRRYPLETINVNVDGTKNLLELAAQHKAISFLYFSSSEVYGDPPPEWIPTPETYWGNVSFTGPRACYDESKRLAETLCMVHHRQLGIPVKVVRPFNVYGPTMRLDDGRIIPDLLDRALKGLPLVLFSDGRATRSFCYVSDAVTAILLVLLSDQNGEAFNVGNNEEVSIGAVAELVDELMGGGLGVQFQENQDPDYVVDSPQRRCPDLRKLESTFQWKAEMPVREGLKTTIRWYQEAGTV